MKKSIASILVAHVVLPLLLVACSEDEPSKVDRPNEDHIHKACRFLVSRDGKAAVDYADYDLSISRLYIPAEGGEFSFSQSDDARYCESNPMCELYNQPVIGRDRLWLSQSLETFWNCKNVPLTLEEIKSHEERWTDMLVNPNADYNNPDFDYSPAETRFGMFISEEDGFTIQVTPNLTDKEKSYFFFLVAKDDPYDTTRIVQIIQACAD